MMNKKIDINIVTHEYKIVNKNMVICTACHHQFFKVPNKGSCPECGCNEMVVIEGEYKELSRKDNINYKEC